MPSPLPLKVEMTYVDKIQTTSNEVLDTQAITNWAN